MLNGYKTYVGATLAAIPLAWAAIQAGDWTQFVVVLGGWLTAIGAAHKAAKIAGEKAPSVPKPAATAAALCLVMLTGCQTLPATQTAKDEAGRSEVTQKASTIQNDLRDLLPRQMKIESPGEVSFVFNFYGNERSSDISQTNSGSTTTETAKTQGQEQTPTSTPTVEVPVTVTPTGQ